MESQEAIIDRNAPIEQRVFRLETEIIAMKKNEGEMMDRLKNAHHRIDETNTQIQEIKREMRESFKALDQKVENIGLNLADKDKKDKKVHRWLIIIGVLAVAAFLGTFIVDSGMKQTLGEIALKVGVGVASTV